MRRLLPAALFLAPALVAAQATTTHPAGGAGSMGAMNADPDKQVAGGLQVPGWAAHFDRPGAGAAAVKFVPMGAGYHVTAGPAAIYYDSSKSGTGAYTVRGTFTQTKAPAHPEAYGLFVAGRNLGSNAPSYLYFIVRGDGRYAVKQRTASDVKSLVDFAAAPALRTADASGRATNALRIQVTPDSVRFYANDKPVIALAATATGPLVGVAGFRVNHNLDVQVENFAVTSGAGAGAAKTGAAKTGAAKPATTSAARGR